MSFRNTEYICKPVNVASVHSCSRIKTAAIVVNNALDEADCSFICYDCVEGLPSRSGMMG